MIWLISLVISLVLVLPTFGVSLLVWIIVFIISLKRKQRDIQFRHHNRDILNGYVNQPGRFFEELYFPRWKKTTKINADRCGSLILNYISQNPSEMKLFIEGVSRATRTTLSTSEKNASMAATIEMSDGLLDKKIHLVCFRAVEALVANNDFDYFNEINMKILKQYISEIERTGQFELDREFLL